MDLTLLQRSLQGLVLVSVRRPDPTGTGIQFITFAALHGDDVCRFGCRLAGFLDGSSSGWLVVVRCKMRLVTVRYDMFVCVCVADHDHDDRAYNSRTLALGSSVRHHLPSVYEKYCNVLMLLLSKSLKGTLSLSQGTTQRSSI